jgi:hypothetical protein
VTLSNTLSNLGDAYFGSNVLIDSNLYVNQQVTFSNTLSNLGNAFFGSNVIVMSNVGIQNINVQYALDVQGDINYTGALRRSGVVQWYNQPSSITVYPDSNIVYGASSVNAYVVFGSVFNSNTTYFGANVDNSLGGNSNNVILLKLPGTYHVRATFHSVDMLGAGYCVNSSSNDVLEMIGYDPSTNNNGGIVSWNVVNSGTRCINIDDVYTTPRTNDELRFVQLNNSTSSYADWITTPYTGISKITIQYLG